MRQLIIKGDKFQAAQAAADRGIPLVHVEDHTTESGTRETVGLTNADVLALNRWMCEEPYSAPYPVGSLLFWSETGR